jgi:hypothetical protein
MWTFRLEIGGAVPGVAGGAALGHLAKSRIQKSKGTPASAMMTLAFMGCFNFIPPETTTFAEPPEKMKVKKGANPGDPPKPD